MPDAYAVSVVYESGVYVARCRDFPDLVTTGLDENEAIAKAQYALSVEITAYLDMELGIPAATAPVPGEIMIIPAEITPVLDR